MSIRTLARLGALPAAAFAVALCTTAPASAHVTVTPTTTAAGSYTVALFSIGHGCEESPTTRVAISIPEEILEVKPTRQPFWNAKVVREKLAEPKTDAHGNQATERVSEIVFTARQPLPDGVRDALELSFQVPETEGEMLVFPVIQTCAQGENAWTQVPAEGQDHDELETPAPSFRVTSADEEHEGSVETTAVTESAAREPEKVEGSGGQAMGVIGAGAGLLGLAAGATALARVRRRG
jgi:uncharacterized protein YcnI